MHISVYNNTNVYIYIYTYNYISTLYHIHIQSYTYVCGEATVAKGIGNSESEDPWAPVCRPSPPERWLHVRAPRDVDPAGQKEVLKQ